MVRFDQKNFDHNTTGYNLEGEHKVIDCRSCHKPDNIQDRNLKKRADTFLGLDEACLSCHTDFHQGTLDKDCMKCHDMKAFRPASKFNHDKADFRLKGKHKEVDCKECHKTEIRNGKEFQVFNDIPFSDCVSCHEDPHKGKLANACAQCHTEDAFNLFVGKKSFDHNKTKFALKGKHNSVDCFSCHKKTSEPLNVFQDRLGVGVNDCKTCHEDAHEGKFGNDCAKCHTEKSFKELKNMDFFDHSVTDYPLEGKHTEVDCKKCHSGSYTDPIDFSACNKCHQDYHKGDFLKDGSSPDCNECHSLIEGFGYTLYSIEQHQETAFPLEGAHMATPCFACHVSEEETWRFRDLGTDCISCHENVHEAKFAIDGVTDCKRCHEPNTWFPSRFDHNLTAFPLEGEHASVECKACHTSSFEAGKEVVLYKLGKFECIDCHQ